MADQVSIQLAETIVNAGSAVTATVNFRTRSTAAASTPTSIRYRVDCLTSGRQVIADTSVAAASSVSITIPGTSNGTIDDGKEFEVRQLTVTADYGLSTQAKAAATWRVRNIRSYSFPHSFEDDERLEPYYPITDAEEDAGLTDDDLAHQYEPGDVLRYGATGDGVTDDTDAIQEAIDLGGGVYFPAGTFMVSGLLLASNVHLVGSGKVTTTIKLLDSSNQHTIRMVSVSNVSIRDLTVDANRSGQSNGVHGIRLESASHVLIENVEVKECRHYGIGAQAGTMTHIKFLNLDIHDVGGDGIDFKNPNDDNLDIQIANVSVRQWGLITAAQKGIDIRGPANLANICISEPPDDGIGVHFNAGELLEANGLGGHRSSMTGFDIRMGSAATGYGVRVGARDVAISNGYINGGLIGVRILDHGCKATGVTVEEVSNDGWNLDILSGDEGNEAVLIGCKAINCTDSGFVIETDDNNLIGCQSIDNDDGFVFVAGAVGNRIIGGRVSGNATNDIVGLDSNNVIINLNGYADEPVVTAAAIAAVGNTVNTANKYSGRKVWDSTNNRLMRASGSAAADPWYVIDGSTSVTPA
jgi:hypothetical protein